MLAKCLNSREIRMVGYCSHLSLPKKRGREMSRYNLIGQRFNHLVVIGEAQTRNKGTKNSVCYWKCKCDCGKIIEVSTSNLTRNHSKSCGCFGIIATQEAKIKHGYTGTRIYHEWVNIKDRCNNPKCKSYKNYGGRGITICEEWDRDFTKFRDWAMANGYDDNLSIDRIDNNGNYEPSNCRWADTYMQARNTRKNVFLTYNGETKTVSEWAEILGIQVDTLYARRRYGWSDARIIETPVGDDKWHPYIRK